MAGSSMTFAYDDGHAGRGRSSTIRTVTATWVSDSATGAVTGTTEKIAGHLIKAVTVPGSPAPTDNYDIAITDSTTLDILASCKKTLIDRDTATVEEVYFAVLNNDTTPLSMARQPVVCDALTIAITNAGNSKAGQVILYYRP